jgi:hypothetical protein
MHSTFYLNKLSGQLNREIYEGENDPPCLSDFDTWLDFKCLNFFKNYPLISFDSNNDFAESPRPYNLVSKNKVIPGFFITFKNSAISESPMDYTNYMKIRVKSAINKRFGDISIFFPKSACYLPSNQITKIYIDGSRPTCNNTNNPFAVMNYDTWLNIGDNHPLVAFNQKDDFLDFNSSFYESAIRFKHNVISDCIEGMNNPIEADVNNNNVIKNSDGTITINIPKKDYIYMGSFHSTMDDIVNGPYIVNF